MPSKLVADQSSILEVALLGGAGFVGTRLASVLSAAGIRIRICDVATGERFPQFWTRCDVRDRASVLSAIQGSDTVINLAAEHRDDVRPLSRYHETNVKGAAAVCAAATKAGIRRIIFTSSVAVYGFQSRPVDEDGPFEPFNEYGKTKFEAEHVYRSWAAEDLAGRTLVIVRPTVIFGEGNRGNVYNLLRQVASGRFLMVGSGENRKSMAYVGNVAAFLMHSLSFGPGIHDMNYVDGPDMSTKELVHLARKCLGKSGRVPSVPKSIAVAGGVVLDALARVTDQTFPISAIRIQKFCANTQFKAERAVQSGFIPPFSLAEGLERTIKSESWSTSQVAGSVNRSAEE